MKDKNIRKRICYNPMSDKIYLGTYNYNKDSWIGDKENITGDWLCIAMHYFKEDTIRHISDDHNLIINIKRDEDSIKKAIKRLHLEIGLL